MVRLVAGRAAILWLGTVALSRAALDAALVAGRPLGPGGPAAVDHARVETLGLVHRAPRALLGTDASRRRGIARPRAALDL